jgi:hypothetical protein
MSFVKLITANLKIFLRWQSYFEIAKLYCQRLNKYLIYLCLFFLLTLISGIHENLERENFTSSGRTEFTQE